jgi:hypothetical protein
VKTSPHLISLALLLTASTSFAGTPGIDLSWSGCDTSPSSTDRVYACDGLSGTTFSLQGSFRLDHDLPDFAGAASVVDCAWDGAIPDYWKTGSGQCNSGAILPVRPLNTGCSGSNLFDPCCSYSSNGANELALNRLRFRIETATGPPTLPSVVTGALYGAFRMQLDPDQGVMVGCAGCAAPACFVLKDIEVFGFGAGEDYLITVPDQRLYVTWQGGALAAGGCPGATPARNTTWGTVKALYR